MECGGGGCLNNINVCVSSNRLFVHSTLSFSVRRKKIKNKNEGIL